MNHTLRRLPLALLGGALALLIFAAGAGAQPVFGPAQTVAGDGGAIGGLEFATALTADGRSVAAFVGSIPSHHGMVARRGDTAGRFGAPQFVSRRGDVGPPSTALETDGTAGVAWPVTNAHENGAINAVVGIAGRRFGSEQHLVTGGSGLGPVTLLAGHGRLVAVWSQRSGSAWVVRYAIAGSSGRFGAAQTVATSSRILNYVQSLSTTTAIADPAGNVTVFWRTPGSAVAGTQAEIAVLPAGADRFDAPRNIALDETPNVPATLTGLFEGPGGIGLGFHSRSDLELIGVGAGGQLAPPAIAQSSTAAGLHPSTGPMIALPSSGGTVAAWTHANTDPDQRVQSAQILAAAQNPDGGFGAPSVISTPGAVAQYPNATATRDDAIVTWGEGTYNDATVRYAVRPAGSGFTAPRTLGTGADGRSVVLAAAGRYALVAWPGGYSPLSSAGTAIHAALLHG